MPIELRRPERTFTIRQLCLEFKVTPRALRFYEDKGLIHSRRTTGCLSLKSCGLYNAGDELAAYGPGAPRLRVKAQGGRDPVS